MFTKQFKAQLGLPETATDAEVEAKVSELKSATSRLSTLESHLESEKKERAKAEADKRRTEASAKVDAWERDGKISGNATIRVRAFFTALAAGETVTIAQFEAVIAALPAIDTKRLATDASRNAALEAASEAMTGVKLEDFAKAGTDIAASKRIAAAVNERKKTNSKFNAMALEREMRAAAPAARREGI